VSSRSDYKGDTMSVVELKKDPLNIIIAGVGGQGNVFMSFLIGSALVRSGYFATVFDNYGASQRLGAVASHIKISRKSANWSPLLHEGDADVIVGIEPIELLRNLVRFGNPEVITITNTRPVYPIGVISGNEEYPDVDKSIQTIRNLSARSWFLNATEEAMKLGNSIYTNVILLGALLGSSALPLKKEIMEAVLKEELPKAFDMNMVALNRGLDIVRNAMNA
jgi:indolepyruvate ferredoxin oxidoreductase beta subunit